MANSKNTLFFIYKKLFFITQKDAHTPQHSLDIFSQQGNAVARGTLHKSIKIKFLFVLLTKTGAKI
jgi:putative heme degradation protein